MGGVSNRDRGRKLLSALSASDMNLHTTCVKRTRMVTEHEQADYVQMNVHGFSCVHVHVRLHQTGIRVLWMSGGASSLSAWLIGMGKTKKPKKISNHS